MLIVPQRLLPPAKFVYRANAAIFDGSSDYMARDNDFLGAEENDVLFSCWMYIPSFSLTGVKTLTGLGGWLDGDENERFGLLVNITPESAAANSAFKISVLGDFCNDDFGGPGLSNHGWTTLYSYQRDTWYHLLYRVSNAGPHQFYINNQEATVASAFNNAEYFSFYSDSPNNMTVGAVTSPGDKQTYQYFYGYIAEFWLDTSLLSPFDMSLAAKRRTFIDPNNKPAYLGPHGNLPLGVNPKIYLNRLATQFGVNAGTGGNFSISGSLLIAPSP
ncbi:MAG: hypothetical protein AB7G80_04990 [Dongiaceae bacterium]